MKSSLRLWLNLSVEGRRPSMATAKRDVRMICAHDYILEGMATDDYYGLTGSLSPCVSFVTG